LNPILGNETIIGVESLYRRGVREIEALLDAAHKVVRHFDQIAMQSSKTKAPMAIAASNAPDQELPQNRLAGRRDPMTRMRQVFL
jgi:hypothetical protein